MRDMVTHYHSCWNSLSTRPPPLVGSVPQQWGEAWRLLESMCPDERKCLARLGRLADVSSCYPRLIMQGTKSLILLNGPPFSSPPCKSREKASQHFHCLSEFSSKKLWKLKVNNRIPADSPLLLSRRDRTFATFFIHLKGLRGVGWGGNRIS